MAVQQPQAVNKTEEVKNYLRNVNPNAEKRRIKAEPELRARLNPDGQPIPGSYHQVEANPQRIVVRGKQMTVAEINQSSYEFPRGKKIEALTRILEAEPFDGMLIFVRTKHGADRLSNQLFRDGGLARTIAARRACSSSRWWANRTIARRTRGRRSATTPPMRRATTLAMVRPAMRRPPVPSAEGRR